MISGIAPELITTRWFNTDRALTLADLRGRVVVIEAFQMLCPGCVSHSLPQAMRVAETFRRTMSRSSGCTPYSNTMLRKGPRRPSPRSFTSTASDSRWQSTLRPKESGRQGP